MKAYYEVDSRWDIFGIHSQEEYKEHCIVEGYFHEAVPKDIKDAFVTVSHLTAQAYFYYPIYDEAFNKALRVLEMSVKHKAESIGISLITSNEKKKNLDTLIKEICTSNELVYLFKPLDIARKMRNYFMHPHNYTLMGITNNQISNIKLLSNIINALFQSTEWHVQRQSAKALVSLKIKDLVESPLFMGSNTPLLKGVIDFEVYENNVLFLTEPIRTNITELIKKKTPLTPIELCLYDYRITAEGFEGKNILGEKSSLTQTSHPTNFSILEQYKQQISTFEEKDKHEYEFLLSWGSTWLKPNWEFEMNKTYNVLI